MKLDGFMKRTKKQMALTWSDEDKQFLKLNYETMTLKELAEHFSKTETQVRNQVHRQQLSKRRYSDKTKARTHF